MAFGYWLLAEQSGVSTQHSARKNTLTTETQRHGEQQKRVAAKCRSKKGRTRMERGDSKPSVIRGEIIRKVLDPSLAVNAPMIEMTGNGRILPRAAYIKTGR